MKITKLFNKKANEIKIVAPVEGRCIPIKEVSDPTFGQEILGPAVAIIPSSGFVWAPYDGVVSTIFPTGHAVGLTTPDGIGLLIHIGLDTVRLNGKYFTKYVEEGQKVKAGEKLIGFDLSSIRNEGYDIVTPIVICDAGEYSTILKVDKKQINVGDIIFRISK